MRCVLCLVLLSGVIGCGDASNTEMRTPATPEIDAGPYDDYFEGGGVLKPDSIGLVIRDVRFFGRNEDGTTDGFDLDGHTSQSGEAASCGHADTTDSEGREGIDNQLGAAWDNLLEPVVGEATHALIKGAINEGRLLLGIELSKLDDAMNAKSAELFFFKAMADPDVGTRGLISPDQTYYVDTDGPMSVIESVEMTHGSLTAGPVEFDIPIDILDEYFIVTVADARIRLQVNEDGSATGLIGGIIDVAALLDEGYETNAAQEFRLVTPFFFSNTDMWPDESGQCRGMSVAIRVEATPGFIVHPAQ